MTRIIDFALSKAKTTLMIAFMIIIAGSYARQEISKRGSFFNLIQYKTWMSK